MYLQGNFQIFRIEVYFQSGLCEKEEGGGGEEGGK